MKIILLVLMTAVDVGAQPQTYAIRLSPPVQPGKTYAVSLKGNRVAKTSVGDRVINAADFQVNFEGTALVAEVDSRSMPIKMVFTVDKFTKVEADATTVLLKAGTVVVCDGRQDQPISLKDGPMDDPVREAFRLVCAAHKPNSTTDDDVFGTKESKSLGQSWQIDRSVAAKSLKDYGVTIPADSLSGAVSLEAKEKIGDVDCLRLRGEMAGDIVAAAGLPDGVSLDAGSFTAAYWGCFPLESAGLFRKEGTGVTVEFHASKAETHFDVTYSEKHDAVWTPVEN